MQVPALPHDETGRLTRLQGLGLLERLRDQSEFDSIVELAATLCGTQSALMTLVDSHQLRLMASTGWSGLQELPRELGFSSHVVAEGRAIEVTDMGADPRFSDNPAVLGAPHIRFYAGIPLRTRDGHVIGTLCVADESVRHLTPPQRRGLDRLAELAIRLIESRHAMQQLEESERRFHELADEAPVMIWMSVKDPDRLEFVNRQWRNFTGLDPEGPVEWAGLVHPDDLRDVVHVARESAREAGSHRSVFRMRSASGEYRWVHVESQPRRSHEGKMVGHIGICIDITEPKLAQVALETAEERLRLVIAATDDAPWDWDLVHGTVYFSPEWWQMIGYEPDELPATADLWQRIAHPDDVERVTLLSQAALTSACRTSRFEMRVRHKQGHYVPIESRAYILRDETGRVLRISGLNSDLTARKQVEVERSHAQELLQQVSARVPGVVYQYRLRPDGSSCLPYASDAIREIFDVSPADVREDASAIFSVVHPEDIEAVYTSITESARTLTPWTLEYRVKHKDGRVRWLLGNAMPQAEPDGSVLWHGFITDCTVRKEVEQERAQLSEQLRESQKMEAIGTLAGGVAHDFNNIAAAILGNTELARQDSQGNTEALRSLEQIRHAAERARELTRQILTFSRRQPTERKLIRLGPHVEQVVRLLRTTLLAPLHVDCQLAPDAPAVLADSIQVDQVLMNLITNAAQSFEGRRGRIIVDLDVVDAPSRHVRIRVTDNGPGMDSHTMARIFEPFFTTKPVGKGTGLGLSVAYGIMRAHEGSITAESRPGEGSVITLLFPASAANPVADGAPLPHGDERPRIGAGQRILYVDDDETLRDLFQRMMQRRGYSVRLAEDGSEALDILSREAGSFDLLLLDYNMPGLTGLDVAREVRKHYGNLPIAIASGFITDEIRDQARALGVMDLVFKPNGVTEYCEVVDRLVRVG